MQTKEIRPADFELVKTMWGKRGQLVNLGFNIRQQYLEAEGKVYQQVDAVDSELNTLVKMLREKDNLCDEWKLDLNRGVFVNSETEPACAEAE